MTKFYFAWVDSQEIFDPIVHNREDEAIFSLKISHREGEFPKALVEIKNPKTSLLIKKRKSRAFISVTTDTSSASLIFQGYVVAMPLMIHGETIVIEFSREGPMDGEKFKEALMTLKEPPYFDPLFMAPEDQDSPQEILDARSQLPHWPRDQGDMVFSDVLEGRHVLDVRDHFIKDSLKISVKGIPFAAVSVELCAEWIQTCRGFCDISPKIKRHLDGGILKTLTGPRLSQRWQSMVEGLHETGYCLMKSNLTLINSRQISIADEPPVAVIACAYDMELCLGWRYQQKRLETLRFTLNHNVQPLLSCHRDDSIGRHKILKIRLQDITKDPSTPHWAPNRMYRKGDYVLFGDGVYECKEDHESLETFYQDYLHWNHAFRDHSALGDQSFSSFFTTPRGMQSLQHAIEMAKSYLAASSRCVHISFKVPLEIALNLSCDHMIYLKDSRLPGVEVIGKVIAYDFDLDGTTGERYAKIAMVSSIGQGQTLLPQEGLEKTPSHIFYKPFHDQLPQQGILEPKKLTADHLVKRIEINNQLDDQLAYISKGSIDSDENLTMALKEIPTDLKVELLSLAGQDVLSHTINVQIPYGWTPPKHIDL